MSSRAAIVSAFLSGALLLAGSEAAESQSVSVPVIRFDAASVGRPVNPLLFGANHRWVENASGSADPATGLTYPAVVAQIKDVGISMIRYPAGLLGNLFRWERAIGPRDRRGLQISGLVVAPVPFDSSFGVDEYGTLLRQTGATGNLLINFGTGTAAEAADFVAYMTAPQGSPPVNGIDWAARRAANGHPEPFPVAYAEIGNEYEPFVQTMIDQNYWIKGEPVSINPACAEHKIACLYAFGGSTRFTDQPVVADADWRPATSISTGAPGQTVYARYRPVAPGSETVTVGGRPWAGRSDLAAAPADAQVYAIDHRTGAITFGDGVHGAIPPKGAAIAVTYVSGPHEGFVDFYRAIKAANPAVRVCSSIHDESFLRIMGERFAYDCLQQHPYAIGNPARDTQPTVQEFFVAMAARMVGLGDQVRHTQHLVERHAGANAGKVELLLSEWGMLGTFPPYARHFARSQGQSVMAALALRQFILAGVAAADRTVLTDFVWAPIPPALAAVQSSDVQAAEEAMRNPENSTSGDFALFAGPGPRTIVTPPALAMKLMRQATGGLITVTVAATPRLKTATGAEVEAVQAYATRDAAGTVWLVVINADPVNDVATRIEPRNLSATSAEVSVLASPAITDENNPSNPERVAIRSSQIAMPAGGLSHVFPRHSVTAIRFPSR
ncbi:MAG: hypothetical protein LCH88_10265 [Proteobacteria bacterium]|nr:hypothetical protein [Pseudomonadota bacterium]